MIVSNSFEFDPLKYPAIWNIPQRLSDVNSWHGHIPFAFAIISLLEPHRFVELGTHKGDSYFSFCQTVDFLNLPTECFAVDTWQGDHHAGNYSGIVYKEVETYNRARYSRFSNLLKMTFDDALSRFENGSIDLLHIDGLHTYEAVQHDFYSWLPKLSNHGVVLLHDIAERRDDFGVWRLWEKIEREFPSMSFTHSHGLGIVVVGSDVSQTFRQLIDSTSEHDRYRSVFQFLSDKVQSEIRTPECSIVISQYGKSELTINCINLLVKHILPHHSCEIIVVDDGSIDDSRKKVVDIFGDSITVLDNRSNLGFSKSCNNGASIAKGEYIVFLNNGVSFHSDWLSPMLRSAQDSSIGIVGARLLYPDQTIQHAGIYFVSNGILPIDPRHLYLGQPKDVEQTLTSGLTSAVTGACLLIRRDLFWNIGGYDEDYFMSFEAIDLCLKVRSLGKGIWYEAYAELIHFEGQTRNSSEKLQRDLQNLIILNRKWIEKFTVPLKIQENQKVEGYAENHSLAFVLDSRGGFIDFYRQFKNLLILLQKGDRLILNVFHYMDDIKEFTETVAKCNPDTVVIISVDADKDSLDIRLLTEYSENKSLVCLKNEYTDLSELRRKVDYIRRFVERREVLIL